MSHEQGTTSSKPVRNFRDKEGYLSTYTVDPIGGYRLQTNSDDEKVIYNVRVKRK